VSFLIVGCLLLYVFAGVIFILMRSYPQSGTMLAPLCSTLAAIFGLVPVLNVLLSRASINISISWSSFFAPIQMRLDPLSGWFALALFIVSPLLTWYGTGYFPHKRPFEVSINGFFFQILAGGIFFVLLASDIFSFLLAWEIMSLAAFFLVIFEHEDRSVQRAGWFYLAATHLGTAFLFAMFVLLGSRCGSLDFRDFVGLGGVADVVFILALIGFGTKAGFFGLHVWLPEAHPAAPPHASALMSGLMIKTGVYGLLRIMTLADSWPGWWGWTLIGVGAVSGVGGALFALVQHDLKRLMAYSSVENIGIVCLGIGMGVFGTYSMGPAAQIAMAGALLHVLNHALFKSCLFLVAGAVTHATGTREIDLLGGLQKLMPRSGGVFLLASAAVCGLPPLNGFVGEFLIYLSSYWSVLPQELPFVDLRVGGFVVIAALALTGGLAAMCFMKAYGTTFLGLPRRQHADPVVDPKPAMLFPMFILGTLCVAFGLGGSFLILLVAPVASTLHPAALIVAETSLLRGAALNYMHVSLASFALLVLFFAFHRLRNHLLKGRVVTSGPTWGCGYPLGTARMQYTGSSFSQPLIAAFKLLLRTELSGDWPEGYLPGRSSFATHTPGVFIEFFYKPLFTFVGHMALRVKRLQTGGTHVYVLYLLLALISVLCWSLL